MTQPPPTAVPALIGVLTVSDRASRGEYVDRGGPAIRDYLAAVLTSPYRTVDRVVADDRATIEDTLKESRSASTPSSPPSPTASTSSAGHT